MHVLHLIAVEADDEDEATSLAEGALEPYGDGQVWDWYSVGGRWTGTFGKNEDGSDRNVLRFSDDPQMFREALTRVTKSQDREFRENLDKILGREIPESQVESLWGMEITDKKAAAERISASNKEWGELWSQLPSLTSLPDTSGPESRFVSPGYGMLGFYLRKLGDCLSGGYSFESYFYDAVIYGTRTNDTMMRCESDPENQFLVAVDLHN